MTENKMNRHEAASIQEQPLAKHVRRDKLAQTLHDRARESSQQLHKLLLSLSTGLLAIYFVALTATEDAAAPGVQTVSAIVGLVATGLAILAGLEGLYADMKRNYFLAVALQANDTQRRDELYKIRDHWKRRLRVSIRALNVLFLLGVTSSIVYIIFRVLDR